MATLTRKQIAEILTDAFQRQYPGDAAAVIDKMAELVTPIWNGAVLTNEQLVAATVAPVRQVYALVGVTPITRENDQGASVTLAQPGTSVSFNAVVQGEGFTFTLDNQTGSDYLFPNWGADIIFAENAAHDSLAAFGVCSVEVKRPNGDWQIRVLGNTKAS